MLGASDEEGARFCELTEPVLGLGPEGELLWHPRVRGVGKFSVVLPKAGVDEALRYSDVSSLYYLSNVREENLTARPGALVEFRVAPDQRSLTVDWAMTPVLYAGFGAYENEGASAQLSARGRFLFESTPQRLNTVTFSLGEESKIEIQGARLQIDETAESLYFVSISDEGLENFSVSYGLRYWNIFNGMDVAWTAGILEEAPFVSVQLEKKVSSATAFLRLSADTDNKPMLHLGFELNFQDDIWGAWRSTAFSGERGQTALDAQSLASHRRRNLPSLWSKDVTLDALKDAHRQY